MNMRRTDMSALAVTLLIPVLVAAQESAAQAPVRCRRYSSVGPWDRLAGIPMLDDVVTRLCPTTRSPSAMTRLMSTCKPGDRAIRAMVLLTNGAGLPRQMLHCFLGY